MAVMILDWTCTLPAMSQDNTERILIIELQAIVNAALLLHGHKPQVNHRCAYDEKVRVRMF